MARRARLYSTPAAPVYLLLRVGSYFQAMERITGILFSGFACRLYAAGLALWIGIEAASALLDAMAAVSAGFEGNR